MKNIEIPTDMKRQTRVLLLIFALCLLTVPVIVGQGYTIRFVAGTERIDRQRSGTGKNLDELANLLSECRPRLEHGHLAVRLTALQSVSERLNPVASEQALLQALALKDYLEEACCLSANTVFDILVDAQTDLNNRVIAEVVTHQPARTTASRVDKAPASRPASGVTQKEHAATVPTAALATAALPPSRPVYRDQGVGFGLSTNLLTFSGVAVNSPLYSPAPNLAAELYFARRFSARLSFAYALPYTKGDKENVFELVAFELEPRFWLRGDGSFQGLYTGVYGQYGTFDVRIREKLANNCKGSYVGVGVSVGWLQPLWQGLYAEAALQVGYRSDALDVYQYTPGEPYKQLAPYTLESFTLQGVNVSVGYRF